MESAGFVCEYPTCGRILSSKYNLKRHIESCHLGVRPYECNICFKRFSSKQNKREHIRLQHSYSETTPIPTIKIETHEDIPIPKLTNLVMQSQDPELRPLSKVVRIYMYSEGFLNSSLPPVSTDRQANSSLPSM
mmetsp:Transcript_2652/g.4143  ORF Transcript_2652/g.4143 Transcript_2652/m.4143 type:complete len:134 (+) Transcript_2652:11-412(+)